MDLVSTAFHFVIALLIGVAIGMEREINEKKSSYKRQPAALHGVRTFSLAAILGGIAGMLFPSYPPVSLFICIFFGILLVIAYALDVWITRDAGITTEIGLLFCFPAMFQVQPFVGPLQHLLIGGPGTPGFYNVNVL
jgi:hypothetical protein